MPGPAAPRIPSCAAGVPIFRTLPPPGLAALGRILRHRAARRGQAVAYAGEPVDHLIIVATGQLKAVRTSPCGREQVVRTLEPGDFVGELALFCPARHEQNVAIGVVTVVLLLAGIIAGRVHLAEGMLVHEASVLAVIVNGMRLLRAEG